MIPSAFTAFITSLRHVPIWEIILFTAIAAGTGIVVWCFLVWIVLKFGNLFGIQGSNSKMGLEIEPISSENLPAKKHPFHIRVLNRNPKLNADDVKVEIVSFTDNLSAQFQSVAQRYYHPSHFDKVAELKSATGRNTINPNDGLEFTVFHFESSIKIQGQPRSVIATFDLKNGTIKGNVASFQEGKKYQIKFAASARAFARIEKEFNMEFFSDDGICKIALTPFVPPTKEEVRQKSEKAVEKLTEFSTVFFQRLNVIRTIPAAQYNPEKDDVLWKNNDAAIAYIVLNLNDAAGKVYDDGVAEITPYSVRKNGVGSTRFEDDQNVVLARTHQRVLNLKRIIEGIEKYIK